MQYVRQEKPVTTDHEVLGKIEFLVEAPQPQSVEEVTVACGGADAHVAFVCGQIATNAKNAARAYARNFEVPKDTPKEKYPDLIAQIAAKGQAIAHDYSPAADAAAGPSKAKKAAAFDQLDALVKSDTPLTREKLMELLNSVR